MTMVWEVISEWLAMANSASRRKVKMNPVDNRMPLVVVVDKRRPHLQPQRAAAEEAADSSRSKERVFK